MTSVPADLAARILEHLDEWEEGARDTGWMALEFGVDSYGRDALSERVLATCAALRQIVEEHPITTRIVGYGPSKGFPFGCEVCHDWDGVTVGDGYCATLRAVASIWGELA